MIAVHMWLETWHCQTAGGLGLWLLLDWGFPAGWMPFYSNYRGSGPQGTVLAHFVPWALQTAPALTSAVHSSSPAVRVAIWALITLPPNFPVGVRCDDHSPNLFVGSMIHCFCSNGFSRLMSGPAICSFCYTLALQDVWYLELLPAIACIVAWLLFTEDLKIQLCKCSSCSVPGSIKHLLWPLPGSEHVLFTTLLLSKVTKSRRD